MILINLLILPIVVSEAVQRLMKQKLDRIWDHILYYGWNILLCLWSGHVLTGVIRSLLLVDIQTELSAYGGVLQRDLLSCQPDFKKCIHKG